MTRVLLIFPPSAYRNHTPPLNLACIAAVLENAGCDVKIIDLSALKSPHTIESAIREAETFKPAWIGLTLNVIFIKPAYDFIRKLKHLNIPIVVGGPHPSLLMEEALQNGCDIVIRGEGEQTVAELNDALINGKSLETVNGLAYRKPDGTIHTTNPRKPIRDLDSLPLPAKHLFPREWYVRDTEYYQVYGAIFSGRGCPAACTYCYKGVFGAGCRLRSAQNVFDEMVHLNTTFGVTAFEFMDDAFSADPDRVNTLCDLILAKPDFNIKWQCTTRLDLTEPDLLVKMKKSGCFRIFYGVESGDPDTLFRVNKHLDIEQIVTILRWTHDAGIRTIVGFMWGFPWDSPASVRASIRFIKRLSPYVDEFNPLGLLIPVPGTRLFNDIKDHHSLDNWWLKDQFGKLYRDNVYFPYFQRRFYNDFGLLEDGFFPYPAEVKRLIKKGIRSIGTHNLFRNNPFPGAILTYMAVMVSSVLFRINPNLERSVFESLAGLKQTKKEQESACEISER
jgi:anaerobic magnesium-protoporphyrin IX monomethyl ester cyclase